MTTFLAQNQFISNPSVIGTTAEGPAAALSRTSIPDAQTDAAAGTFDEEYRCPGGQIVDAAGCELCGPISNADCPYWPDEPTSNEGRPSEAPASAPTKNPDAGALGTDHIHEIFAGARRLPPRELPPDFQERLLAAIESDVWADDPPLFLQKREA